jgi:prepilin-type N-terminal cleavage/methylation domain-containing protein
MLKELKKARRQNPLNGFTLVEVVVAAIIFAIAAAGMMATVSSLTTPAAESSREVTAAFIGKQILENLRRNVNAENWNTGNLSTGFHPAFNTTINEVGYISRYRVVADPAGTAGRQVILNVTWQAN